MQCIMPTLKANPWPTFPFLLGNGINSFRAPDHERQFFLASTPSQAYQPGQRRNAACRRTGYLCTDPRPKCPSSALRTPASPIFFTPAFAGILTPGEPGCPACSRPDYLIAHPAKCRTEIWLTYHRSIFSCLISWRFCYCAR